MSCREGRMQNFWLEAANLATIMATLPHKVLATFFSHHRHRRHPLKLIIRQYAGPDLLSAGSCSEKMWGPFTWGGRPYFSWKKLATFLVITVRVSGVSSPQKLATFICSSLSFTRRGRPLFPACKNLPLLLWGALFGRTCWTCLNPPLNRIQPNPGNPVPTTGYPVPKPGNKSTH